jgi:hypothetical protein
MQQQNRHIRQSKPRRDFERRSTGRTTINRGV